MSCKSLSHILIFDYEKGKATFVLKCMVLSQRLTLHVKIWKISSTDLKKRCIIQKGSIVMIYVEAKWKTSKFCNHSLVGVIYVHFYNWDWPLDFVSVVYDLIKLIIEVSLWSMDYSTFDTHTQHTRLCSVNAYLICMIVHVRMWCVCSNTYWSNPTRFLSVLYVFESDFILSCF